MIDASITRKKLRTPRQLERAMRPKEHDIQAAFFIWVRYELKFYPVLKLFFAVPNGGHRAITTARKLKQEGVRPGIPDTMLPAPRRGKTGLAIEFKRPGEKQTADQIEVMDLLVAEGWEYHVVDDFEDAIVISKAYLGIS